MKKVKRKKKRKIARKVACDLCECNCAFLISIVVLTLMMLVYLTDKFPEPPPDENAEFFNENTFISANMMNTVISPCKDFDSFSCNKEIDCSKRNTSKRINYIETKLNRAIMYSEEHEALRTLFKNFNTKMSAFYKTCNEYSSILEIPNMEGFPLICEEGLKGLVPMTVGQLFERIDRIKTMTHFSAALGILSSCGIRGDFFVSSVETPFEFGRRLVPLLDHFSSGKEQHSSHYFDQEAKYVVEKMKSFKTSSSSRKEIDCYSAEKVKHIFLTSKFNVDSFIEHSGLIFDTRKKMCSRKNGFLYFLNDLLKGMPSIQFLRSYLKDSVYEYVERVKQVPNNCLERTRRYFPVSYCNSFKSGLYKIDEITHHFEILGNQLKDYVSSELYSDPEKYCIEKGSLLHKFTVKNFDQLNMLIGECFLPNAIYDPMKIDEILKKETEVKIDEKNFVHNVLRMESISNRWFSLNGIDLYADNPLYVDVSHHVVVPLAFILEPLSSIYHDRASQIGSFDFVLGHEMAHVLLDFGNLIGKKTEFEEKCLKNLRKKITNPLRTKKEQICDVFALRTISDFIQKNETFGEVEFKNMFIAASQVSCCSRNYKKTRRIFDVIKNDKEINNFFNKVFGC